MKLFRASRGFTLIELLVVVAIIAVLVSILLPALSQARERARTVLCANQMRQLNLQIVQYAHEYADFFPQSEVGGTFYGYTGGGLPWCTLPLGGEKTWPVNSGLIRCPSVQRTNYSWRSMDIGYNAWLGYPGGSAWSPGYQFVRTSQVDQPSDCALLGDISLSQFSDLLGDGLYRIFEYGSWPSYRHGGQCSFFFVDGHAKPMRMDEAEPLYFVGGWRFAPPMAQPFWWNPW
ncbi:MAG: prepilin-type N-terminal cleavage/methylation domain-containing protein [Phycisphaerae bacterium]|nr:prepilin-type N-terminal cleavage/methylation domain-containing protein [Phycisphaerae bacterium]